MEVFAYDVGLHSANPAAPGGDPLQGCGHAIGRPHQERGRGSDVGPIAQGGVEAPSLPSQPTSMPGASVRSAVLGAPLETSGMDKGARKIMITQELDPQDGREGMWTRLELMRMNARFEAAMDARSRQSSGESTQSHPIWDQSANRGAPRSSASR